MEYNKYLTFSYDDGVTQDLRLIDIFDRYSLKATFNINSALLGKSNSLVREGVRVSHNKVESAEVRKIYANHEVAVHTLTHPNLTELCENDIINQVENDRLALSALVGYEVRGMAYPCGGVNNDNRVAEIIRKKTGVVYSRTIESSLSLVPPENLYRFSPTGYHISDMDRLFELADELFSAQSDEPRLLYVWGHSYEFDINDTWDKFERFCEHVAGKSDIFYGTNIEVFKRLYGERLDTK